ncbi:tetratricopeptide repeat protein, partial [Streptomyces sp. NPDC002138]|uniref:tetratricopeptide repeat protein n=1 Tax=Streptomyces sp. NPDC002138 TaxID=3154410 RepID=UPI00332400FE
DAGEALRMFEGALRTDPAQAEARGGRARALASLGREGEAVRDYRMALGRAPVPHLALELGELLESLGRTEEARVPYELLASLASKGVPNGVGEDVTLGLFEADHGNPAAAVRRLTAEWGRHKNMQVADALGWALHRAGDDPAALEYAKKATEPGVRSADFAYHRGQIERGLGDVAAARRFFEEALRTNPRFSPLRGPQTKEALEAVGRPAAGGPENMQPTTPWVAPVLPKPSAKPSPSASAH